MTAILSVDVLNAATPIVIAVIAFGWLIYARECRDNNKQFHAQHAGVYFAFISMATFGFGGASAAVVFRAFADQLRGCDVCREGAHPRAVLHLSCPLSASQTWRP